MLVLEAVTKRFKGITAVQSVSFCVPQGAITGLIGPNGAGKTTLFNCIAGLYATTSGRILFEEKPINGFRPDAIFNSGLARTFQIPRPFPDMTVLDNVMVARRAQRGEMFWENWLRYRSVATQESETKAKALQWLDFMGLADLAGRPARILSGGQRKLLELARVMVAEPRLILLDEPGAGVNPRLLDTLVDRIAALNRTGTTFLLIEHNMPLVAALCGEVIVMADGGVLTKGTPAQVTGDARVREAYMGGAAA